MNYPVIYPKELGIYPRERTPEELEITRERARALMEYFDEASRRFGEREGDTRQIILS